ncbi:hypothetical protein VJI76_02090 [Parvimonas sp. M13]|nr:hypothetical protein [Parvimonas sp. M13]
MTGYWHCDFLINGKYYATISEIYETKKLVLLDMKMMTSRKLNLQKTIQN